MKNAKTESTKIQNSSISGEFYPIRGASCSTSQLWHDDNDFVMLDRKNGYLVRKEEFVLCSMPYYTNLRRTQISLSIEKIIDREDPYFPIRQNADTCLSSSGYRVMKLYRDLLNLCYDIKSRDMLYLQARFGSKPTLALHYSLSHTNTQNESVFVATKLIETSYPYQTDYVKKFVSDTYGFVPDNKLKGLTCPLHLRNSMTSWSLF